MQIVGLVLLIVIAALMVKREFGLRVISANPNEWFVLEWSQVSDAGEGLHSRQYQTSLHIRFIPIIGWTYKRGKIDVVLPPAYHKTYLPLRAENYKAVSYWIRDGAVFDIADADYSSHTGDFWENFTNQAVRGAKIEIDGSIPMTFQKKVSEILALADERQDANGIEGDETV